VMRANRRKIVYLLLRLGVAILGLFLVLSGIDAHLEPESVAAEARRLNRSFELQRAIEIGRFCYGLILLIPHRLTEEGVSFYGKLLLLVAGSSWMLHVLIKVLVDVSSWREELEIIPVTIIFILLTVAAPVTLMMRKYISDSSLSDRLQGYGDV